MNTETATVETLTAEVRALMVGNRQVTLTMYKQLDYASYGAMDVMGRVRAGLKVNAPDLFKPLVPEIELVGRLKSTGALVRSFDAPWFRNYNANWTQEQGQSYRDARDSRLSELRALPLLILAGLR